ncbi:MAG: hypothetical protein PVSMB1_15100 [Gemmatimonadaceae bacterium]
MNNPRIAIPGQLEATVWMDELKFSRMAIGLLIGPLLLVLGGCGTSTSATPPTPKPTVAIAANGHYTDPTTGMTIRLGKIVIFNDHALLLVTMRGGNRQFQLQDPVGFADSAIAQPTARGVPGSCGADDSRGSGLNFQTLPAGATHRGWIRCDFPTGSHVLIVGWMGHALGTYHLVS